MCYSALLYSIVDGLAEVSAFQRPITDQMTDARLTLLGFDYLDYCRDKLTCL